MNFSKVQSINKVILTVIILLIITSVFVSTISFAAPKTEEQKKEGVNLRLVEFRRTIGFYTGYFTAATVIISVGVLIVHFLRLATGYNHPLHRRKVFEDIAVVLLGISLLGSVGLIVGLLVRGWFIDIM